MRTAAGLCLRCAAECVHGPSAPPYAAASVVSRAPRRQGGARREHWRSVSRPALRAKLRTVAPARSLRARSPQVSLQSLRGGVEGSSGLASFELVHSLISDCLLLPSLRASLRCALWGGRRAGGRVGWGCGFLSLGVVCRFVSCCCVLLCFACVCLCLLARRRPTPYSRSER